MFRGLKNWMDRQLGRNQKTHRIYGSLSIRETVQRIYRTREWGDDGSPYHSGSGSRDAASEQYCAFVIDFIRKHNVRSVVDLGCGDFAIGRQISEATGVSYTGIDVVPELIEHHSRTERNRLFRFQCADITSDPLPTADLCLICQVLQHLSNDEIAKVLNNLGGFPQVLITEHLPIHPRSINLDKPHGPDVRVRYGSGVYLELPPFSLPTLEVWKIPHYKKSILKTVMLVNKTFCKQPERASENNLKILVLFSHVWRGGRAGGAETHALQLMKELSLRGHQIYFVAASGNSEVENTPPGVLAEYRLPFQSLNPFDKLTAYRRLIEIVTRHQIDIIHAHHRTGGYFAEAIFRRTGVPYVITVHDIWHRAPFKSLHGRIIRRMIAVSGFIKRGLTEKFGVAADQVRIIHNGIDPAQIEKASGEEAAQIREKFGVGGEVVFSLVARITESKGHYDVIEALKLLPRELNYKCLIAGEGKDKQKLQALVARYGLGEKVVFCGFQANIPALMKASDVILLPSHREPFGLSILEGMFAGKPLLVSSSGGIPEIVTNDREGIVFPARGVAALAKAIVLLVEDPALRHRLGEEAYRTANRRFLLSKMIDDTEAYYREIVRKAGSSQSFTQSFR